LPTHAHLVVMRMRYPIEQISNLLKGAASAELMRRGLHPFADQAYRNGKLPSPWARHEWSCFLDCDDDIRRSIDYTVQPPERRITTPALGMRHPLARAAVALQASAVSSIRLPSALRLGLEERLIEVSRTGHSSPIRRLEISFHCVASSTMRISSSVRP
jgi:hypothetical protein